MICDFCEGYGVIRDWSDSPVPWVGTEWEGVEPGCPFCLEGRKWRRAHLSTDPYLEPQRVLDLLGLVQVAVDTEGYRLEHYCLESSGWYEVGVFDTLEEAKKVGTEGEWLSEWRVIAVHSGPHWDVEDLGL